MMSNLRLTGVSRLHRDVYVNIRCLSTGLSDATIRSNRMFDQERKRQQSLVPRVEKINVKVKDTSGVGSEIHLLMNKHQSTPMHCAKHVHELHTTRSVVAQVDDQLWDMSRPLEQDCSLSFRHFMEEDPTLVNKVFWRSCSFLLGMVIETSFKRDLKPTLHSWPKPIVRSGSFVYDASMPVLSESGWKPTLQELLTFTSVFHTLKEKNLPFERLKCKKEVAQDIMQDNPFKLQHISLCHGDEVTLYRVADHIDMSVGPMISSTNQVGRVSVTAVHQIQSKDDPPIPLYRFQGVGIPSQLRVNHFVYKMMCERSRKLRQDRSQA